MGARTPQGATPPLIPRRPSRDDTPSGPGDGPPCPIILRWLDHHARRHRDLLRTIGGASRLGLATIPVRR
jgi:hypothetical protein